MIYVLITVGAFMSIITTAIFKSITKETKHQNLKRTVVVALSFLIFVLICIYVLNQKLYQ